MFTYEKRLREVTVQVPEVKVEGIWVSRELIGELLGDGNGEAVFVNPPELRQELLAAGLIRCDRKCDCAGTDKLGALVEAAGTAWDDFENATVTS